MRILWVLAVACFISGCGGGGGDSSPPGQVPAPIPSEPPPPPPVQDVSANGNWRASVIEDGIDYTYGIILQDGALLGLITALEDEDIVFLEGSYTVTGTEISGSYRMSTAETGTFSGTVVEGESISLTINSGGETSSLRVNLHPDYNRPSSLSLVQGTWVQVLAGESVSTVTVSADGAFFGQDIFGCVITGAVTIINAAHNLYDLLYSVAACAESNGEYTGYGILSDAPTGGSNNIFVVLTHSRGTNWSLSQYDGDSDTLGFDVHVLTTVGSCYVDLRVRPGESCTYPGTIESFGANERGDATFLSISSNRVVQASNISMEGQKYDLIAAREDDGVWRVDRVAGSTVTAVPVVLRTEHRRPAGEVYLTTAGAIDRTRIRPDEELVLTAHLRCDDGEFYPAGRFDAPCFSELDPVSWQSSDATVVTVSLGESDFFAHRSAGIVRASGPGRATVTATFKGRSATLIVEVVSGAATAARSTMDRSDDHTGPQIHFVYAVANQTVDKAYDQAGEIAYAAARMQAWLRAESDMTWRFDTYNGMLDVSYLPMQFRDAVSPGDFVNQLENALEQREGNLDPQKKYAIFLQYNDSAGVFPVAGVANSQIAVALIHGPGLVKAESVAIHEIIHTFGAVAGCAPNSTIGGMHVSDSPIDIMGGGGSLMEGVLDFGRDDYFMHDNGACLDIADNAYWELED